MSVSGGPSSAGNRVQVSGPCTAGPTPRHCSDQSLACVAGADVGGSGSREWKRRTRAGKAQGGAPPLPPRPSRRGGRGRACSLGGFRCRRRYKGRGRACALPARRPLHAPAAPARGLQHLRPSPAFAGTSLALQCLGNSQQSPVVFLVALLGYIILQGAVNAQYHPYPFKGFIL